MRAWRLAVMVGLVLGVGSSSAWALTFQDKQEKAIDEAGITHVVETGTVLHESASDTTVVSGSGEPLTCGTVPTDKKWHVTKVAYQYTGTTTNVRVALLADGVTVDQDGAPTTNEANAFTVDLWMDEAETIQLSPLGFTANDALYCWVHGIEYDATTLN